MKFLLALSLAVVCPPARALAPADKEMLAVIGKSFGKLLFGGQEAARAVCEEGRAGLEEKSPKYLSAYIEACVGLSASPRGPGKKTASCPYFRRALQIWKENPPPKDDDDSRITRSLKRAEWENFLAENCDEEAAARAAAKPAKAAPIPRIPGGIVETQEGLSYELPPGWSVRRFDAVSGWTIIEGPDRYTIDIVRSSKDDYDAYPDQEKLPDGRALETEYKEFIPRSRNFMLNGRLMLEKGYVELSCVRSDSPEGVDKERCLAWVRAVAGSVKVLGPRRCIGDCPPGTVKAKTPVSKRGTHR